MEMKPLLKEWRIWVLTFSLLLSLALLGPHYVQDDDGQWGIETNINQGLDLQGGTNLLVSIDAEENNQEIADQVGNVLEQRISAFGLTQASIRTVNLAGEYMVQVEVADTNQTQIRELVEQEGQFEARMPLHVEDETEYTLFDTHTFTRDNGEVSVNGSTYSPGDDFELDGTRFYYVNDTGERAELEVLAYSGSDIEQVRTGEGQVAPSGGGGFQFQFPVIITREAAENVQRVSQNYQISGIGSDAHLMLEDGDYAYLRLYVDGSMESELRMAAAFAQQVIQQPSIQGGAETEREAQDNMQELQAILQSGSLPASIQVESISTISAALGDRFMTAALLSIISSLIAVGGLIYVRYGDPRLVIPIVFTGSAEVFILLGAFFSTLITLDLAAIAGIIAAVGTGVDDQIIITDERGKDKIRSWKKRLKRAFFVIFTAAATTIGAMAPLINPAASNMAVGAAGLGLIGYSLYRRRASRHYIALGLFAVMVSALMMQFDPSAFALQAVRGFAITTIVGVLVGITITRPAYAKFLEHMDYEGDQS